MNTNVTFGAKLREARNARGYTQRKMAEALNVSRVAYGYYENGDREMRQSDVAQVCKLLGVSADYLLGLSDTKNPSYAKIAETTGLTQESINRLNQFVNFQSEMINQLLAEEPNFSVAMDPEYEAHLNSPEQIEKAYKDHSEGLAREAEMRKTPILKHLENEWAHCDHEHNLTTEERIAREEAMAKQHVCQYIDADDADLGPIPSSKKEDIERENAMLRYEQEEAKKSNLLSAITEYVHYQTGCTLDTMMRSEELTEQHAVRIGTGFGNSITFPSKQADELLEFMLLQKVIDALKAFKQNYFV